jgi:hypothetical protein
VLSRAGLVEINLCALWLKGLQMIYWVLVMGFLDTFVSLECCGWGTEL